MSPRRTQALHQSGNLEHLPAICLIGLECPCLSRSAAALSPYRGRLWVLDTQQTTAPPVEAGLARREISGAAGN